MCICFALPGGEVAECEWGPTLQRQRASTECAIRASLWAIGGNGGRDGHGAVSPVEARL